MHKGFDLPIPNILHTGSHNYYRDAHPGESEEAFASRRAEELEQLILAEGPETVAAFVAEPVLGAGGAVIPPKTYFEKIQAVLAKYDVLMVADEVITGFFRTGNRFACETFGIRPDIRHSCSLQSARDAGPHGARHRRLHRCAPDTARFRTRKGAWSAGDGRRRTHGWRSEREHGDRRPAGDPVLLLLANQRGRGPRLNEFAVERALADVCMDAHGAVSRCCSLGSRHVSR